MNKIKEVIKHLNSGISYIVPLLIIIGLLSYVENDIAVDILQYLKYGVYPLFSAFLMHSIVDRPGIVSGVVIGLFNAFLGLTYLPLIIISLLMSGLILLVQVLFKKTPMSFKAIAPILIIPAIVVFIGGALLYFWAMYLNYYIIGMYTVFDNIYFTIIVSTILASLMAYDLGGPVNKIAFMLGVMSIDMGSNSIYMTAVMVGGMIPPLAIAFDQTINKKKYSAHRSRACINYLNGFLFLTEGAIPYVKKNESKFKIYLMVGSAVAGFIVSFFEVSTMFPHGGMLILWSFEKWYIFLLAIFVGIAVVEPFIYKLEVWYLLLNSLMI